MRSFRTWTNTTFTTIGFFSFLPSGATLPFDTAAMIFMINCIVTLYHKSRITFSAVCKAVIYILARMQSAGWAFALLPCILEIYDFYDYQPHDYVGLIFCDFQDFWDFQDF